MVDISIVFPHLREKRNDQALKIALECIVDNTALDYELMIEAVAARRDIYSVINDMARWAKSDWLVFSNSDVFFAPNWAENLYFACDQHKIIGGVIVECGAIPVNERNYERNFGRTPQTFNRAAFEQFVTDSDIWRDNEPWYFPCLIHRPTFLALGGFDTDKGAFPDPLDMLFWDKWKAAGYTIQRVKSYCYHLQAYSDPEPGRIAAHV